MKRDCGGYSAGAHLFPFRTEKLKPAAPMVLPEEGGRVGRRPIPHAPSVKRGGFFLFKSANISVAIGHLSIICDYSARWIVVYLFFACQRHAIPVTPYKRNEVKRNMGCVTALVISVLKARYY